jgi:hypothetical protein
MDGGFNNVNHRVSSAMCPSQGVRLTQNRTIEDGRPGLDPYESEPVCSKTLGSKIKGKDLNKPRSPWIHPINDTQPRFSQPKGYLKLIKTTHRQINGSDVFSPTIRLGLGTSGMRRIEVD